MTSDHTSTISTDGETILLLLSGNIVKSPEAVEKAMSSLSSNTKFFHHQLLERVSTGAITLNPETYSRIHIADEPSGKIQLDQNIVDLLFAASIPGGKLTGQIDVSSTQASLPLLLAGFIQADTLSDISGSVFIKPQSSNSNSTITNGSSTTPVAVSLTSLKRKQNQQNRTTLPQFKRLGNTTTTTSTTATGSIVKLNLNDDDDDDDLIDENDLMLDESTKLPPAIVLPAKCDPGPGRKRRKACKDCTCGLKELEEQELIEQEEKLKNAPIVRLGSDDMAEIDFTIPGKAVGGCGSCALGDAFRCDGCPYLGLPPFKPGEIVSIAALGGDDL